MPFLSEGCRQGATACTRICWYAYVFIFCMWDIRSSHQIQEKMLSSGMLIFRGIAMALLFIPVTTMSLSTLKGRDRRRCGLYWNDEAAGRFIWYCHHYHVHGATADGAPCWPGGKLDVTNKPVQEQGDRGYSRRLFSRVIRQISPYRMHIKLLITLLQSRPAYFLIWMCFIISVCYSWFCRLCWWCAVKESKDGYE